MLSQLRINIGIDDEVIETVIFEYRYVMTVSELLATVDLPSCGTCYSTSGSDTLLCCQCQPNQDSTQVHL